MGIYRSSSSNSSPDVEIVLIALTEVMKDIFIQQQLQLAPRPDIQEPDTALMERVH